MMNAIQQLIISHSSHPTDALKSTTNEKPASDFPPFLDTWSRLQIKHNKVFGITRQEIVLKSKFVHARREWN